MMTSEHALDDEYREIELYLRQAQEEIGQALSNLETTTEDHTLEYTSTKDPALTGGGGGLLDQSGTTSTRSTSLSTDIPDNARNQLTANEQVLSNEQLRESGGRATGESLSPRDVNANRAGLTTVSGDPSSTQDTTGSKRILQTVDFLSIFAQNDLVEDSTDVSSVGLFGREAWNHTLPNPRRRPDRPKTLTPPPRLQGGQNPFRNQDWRLYVRGDYGFHPIQSHEQLTAPPGCGVTRATTSYVKPKPENPYVSSVRYGEDVDGGYHHHHQQGPSTKVSHQRSSYPTTGPIRPIPTKPLLGIRLGSQAIAANRKITFSGGSQLNGFQRPKSMSDSHGASGGGADLGRQGAHSAGKLDELRLDTEKRALQTENVVQSLPLIKSPTIERKSLSFPTPGKDCKKDGSGAKDSKESFSVSADINNTQRDAASKGQACPKEAKSEDVPSQARHKKEPNNAPHTNNAPKTNNAQKSTSVETPGAQKSPIPNRGTPSQSVKPDQGKKNSPASRIPTRTAQPAIAIPPPPPPTLEEPKPQPSRSSKVVMRQQSPEKRRRPRPRSRSNSGGDVELELSRSERKSTSPKISISTQTDKKGERRRKSDPGYLTKGLLRAARTQYMGRSAILKPCKLDSDNNNIMTAVVKPMKPEVENKMVGRLRKDGNDNNNRNIDQNRNRDNKSKSRSACGSKSSKTNVIVMANSSQETHGGGFNEDDSRKDIRVQVEVFVSCSEKERCGGSSSDSRGRTYCSSSAEQVRAWQRERRVSAKPLMPVIAEVQKASDDDCSESDMEAFDSSTSSSTQSRRGGYARSVSSTSSSSGVPSTSDGLPSPDGPAPPLPPRKVRARPKKPPLLDIKPPPPEEPFPPGVDLAALTPPGSPMPRSPRSPLSSTSSGSGSTPTLLDSLHRRYYPGMYGRLRGGHQGARPTSEQLSRHSNPEVSTSPPQEIVPHSKSASFAHDLADRSTTPERLSDGAKHAAKVDYMMEQLAASRPGPPSDGSTVSSSQPSPCSTLSPPTLRRNRNPPSAPPHRAPPDSSEAESSYGSLTSAKGIDGPPPCSDDCPTAVEETLRTLKSDRELAEIEAVEACKWLRAAGFPQYAQMYEDQLFPIDIASVEKDHDFLDTDSIQSLFRRLNTLNKCANMKIEAPPRKSGDESDEEEQCALSDRWRFQRSSRRWSRRDLDDLLPGVGGPDDCGCRHPGGIGGDDSMDKSGLRSCSSHDSVLTDNEPSLGQLDDSPLLHHRSTHQRHGSVPDSPSYDHVSPANLSVPTGGVGSGTGGGGGQERSERRSMSPISPRLRRAASERFRGAKIFLKRIESFKSKKSKKKPLHATSSTGGGGSGKVEISGPVVMDSTSFQERMDRMGCVDISPTTETPTTAPVMSTTSPPPFLVDPPGIRQRASDLSHHHSMGAAGESCSATSSPKTQPPPPTTSSSIPPSPSPGAGGINKRNGRVFLDSSSSFPSGSSTLSDSQSHSEDPLRTLEHLTPPRTVYPGGHRRNHSSSDIMDMYGGAGAGSSNGGDPKQGSYPMLVSNGYIDVGNGSQINYRTGSFNLGSESEDYKDRFNKRTAVKRAVGDTASGQPPAGTQPEDADGAVVRETTTTTPTPTPTSTRGGEHRRSVYDNVPAGGAESTDAQHELDMILHDLFENINGLSQSLGQCVYDDNTKVESKLADGAVHTTTANTTTTTTDVADMAPMPPAIHDDVPTGPPPPLAMTPADQRATDRSLPAPTTPQDDPDPASASSSTHEMSDGDTPGSREEDGSDLPEARERRDSGVGSSLTRAPSDRRRHRIRWHSFVKSHRPSLNSRSLQICNMSAGQLMVLRKLSLLKVTALMEKYSPTNRSGWNWIMPKFIKRFKVPDYKDKQVFGVPLLVVLQRSGQPLPQCILYAMRSLRRTARDAVGIFRKSGVRSRIQKLHNQIEANPECMDFDQLQAYDVADLLKQYFRELPECLLTNKLSETFIASFTHVPPEMRLEALQAAVMLLPDENREVLQSLLLFLSDMAEHASENQMTASNLAVCFAPSLFHMCGPRNNPAASPKRNRKNMGIPDQKDLMEQKAAHECLTAMITDCKSIFSVPEEMLGKCRLSYIEQGDPVSIEELVKRRADSDVADHTAYMESCIQGLLRESHNKFKGWISVSSTNNIDVAYKKVGDGHPLRLWKCAVDVEAPPVEVLNRVLHERHLWDEDLLKWRVVEKMDAETEVFQYVLNNMAPHPTRDFTELRSWRTNLPKGACVLVSTSVEHPDAGLIGGLRAVVLASRYLIEPCGSGKARLTHMCRIDLRGHTPEWYNKAYGHLCANYVVRVRDSFRQDMDSTAGPETKV